MSAHTVIVTGASRGIGRATAKELDARGANVVLFARSSKALDELQRELSRTTLAVVGDIASDRDRRSLVERTLDNFGSVSAIVNNAALLDPISPIADTSPDQWDLALSVNVTGPAMLTALAIDALRESHGRVINISSGAAVSVIEGAGVYCATKAALKMWTEVMAAEEPDITSIAVRPGVVATSMQETIRAEGVSGMPASTHQKFVEYHRDGRLTDPSTPAKAIAALALLAPPNWSGEHLSWDDPKVAALTSR